MTEGVKKPYETTIRFDWSDEKVRTWFEKLLSTARHPQYRGGIEVREPVPAPSEE